MGVVTQKLRDSWVRDMVRHDLEGVACQQLAGAELRPRVPPRSMPSGQASAQPFRAGCCHFSAVLVPCPSWHLHSPCPWL